MKSEELVLHVFTTSCLEQLESVEDGLLNLESSPTNLTETMSKLSIAVHSIKGDAGSLQLHAIERLAHKMENLIELVRNRNIERSHSFVSILLDGFDLLKKFVSDPLHYDEKEEIAYTPVENLLLLLDKLPKEEESLPFSTETQSPQKEDTFQSQIRKLTVSVENVDRLVENVGELTLAQATLKNRLEGTSDDEIHSLLEKIEKLGDYLREQTLEMRMLPLKIIFTKLRRTVRDLSEQSGKAVNIILHGEETKLDKSALESLNGPMIHLLRNAVDHGIESPEERRKIGKPPEGLIEVTARYMGNEVLLTVKDDGRGLDREAIAEEAIRQGWITSAAEIGEEELLELIFRSGLTTSRKVNLVSGRGIGMEAVKKGIESLRGTVKISSESGKGTTITIRLPSSLAIVACLQVQVSQNNYLFYLDHVLECMELTAEEQEEKIRKGNVVLRGKQIPLFSLRERFRFAGAIPSNHKSCFLSAVDEQTFAIVVDRVIGIVQAVVKKMGRLFEGLETIMGSAITDDGSIALILDSIKLMKENRPQFKR